jgi:2-haloacid dehalogenase
MPLPYDAVLFDLLSALLDSWTLWNEVAGSPEDGRRWRLRYLALTYAAGDYRPYEVLVNEAAAEAGIPPSAPELLLERWDELTPWHEVHGVLRQLEGELTLGVVTNCSEALGHRAVARLGVAMPIVVTAERSGAYKPDPRTYSLALEELRLPAERVLFVAGSPYDVPGASSVGLDVLWHNRAGLRQPEGTPPPLAELPTLDTLPEWLGVR